MRISALTNVTNESQTMLSGGFATSAHHWVSAITALPRALWRIDVSPAYAGSGSGPVLLSKIGASPKPGAVRRDHELRTWKNRMG
jgi:hypothetical protein